MSTEQEYADGPPNVLDDTDPGDQSIGPGPFPHEFSQAPPAQQAQVGLHGQPIHPVQPMQPIVETTSAPSVDPNGPVYAHMQQPSYNSFDPELDADPFGLSASMHFPTQFTYHENPMRR